MAMVMIISDRKLANQKVNEILLRKNKKTNILV